MKQILLLVVVISIGSCKDQPTIHKSFRKKDVSSGLFPIYDKGLWDYIDQNERLESNQSSSEWESFQKATTQQ